MQNDPRRTATGHTDHINELDGYRVLLIFIISWYHIWQQSWWTPYIGSTSLDFLVRTGYIEVDGTILLSGFLLFLPYARAMLSGGPMPTAGSFYRRRAARILPSYYFIMLAVFFGIALPYGLYSSQSYLWKDLLTHLTFTFNLSADTYMSTPLGVACWTLAVEVQMYLLFPWLARLCARRPGSTLLGMVLLSWAWRYVCIDQLTDYAMVVNQLPSFIDVYAVGMAGALLYVWLREHEPEGRRGRILLQLAATALVAVGIVLYVSLLRAQAKSPDYPTIQKMQMVRRFPLAVILLAVIIGLPFALRPVRFLFGNRVMRFLAGISMNYYLVHQIVCVHLKRIHFPYSVSDTPNYDAEMPWQWQYTFLAFGLSLVIAALITYLIEKPCAKAINRLMDRHSAKKAARPSALVRKLAPADGERILVRAVDAPAWRTAEIVRQLRGAGCVPEVRLEQREVTLALSDDPETPVTDCRTVLLRGCRRPEIVLASTPDECYTEAARPDAASDHDTTHRKDV